MKTLLSISFSFLLITSVNAQSIDWGAEITDTTPVKQTTQKSQTVRSLPGVKSEPLKARNTAGKCFEKKDASGTSKPRPVECAKIPFSILSSDIAGSQ